jgi:iron complex outermembrane recepter protein
MNVPYRQQTIRNQLMVSKREMYLAGLVVATTTCASLSPSAEAQTRQGRTIEEVIVTAQKRSERLQDVPVPVTAIESEQLVNTNQVRLEDYYTKLPGLNLTTLGNTSNPLVSIRGVTTGGYINPTVAIVVDDVPFGASAGAAQNGSATLAPSFDPSELSQIEVLRGPQGTLYGASSLGGLLKYVTATPSMDGFAGRLQVGTTSVDGGDDLGYSVRGSVNVPISDTFALRASGSTRKDAGYIDNLQTGEEDVNSLESLSGRLAVLWQPTEDFSVKLSTLYQRTEVDGTPDTHLPSAPGPQTATVSGRPDLGDLEQTTLLGTGWYDQKLQAHSATVTAKFGEAELTSISGYSIGRLADSFDNTPTFGARSFVPFGVRSSAQTSDLETKKFTQEIRLVTPIASRVDWLVGAFYTDEKSDSFGIVRAVDPTTGAVAGTWARTSVSMKYSEYALFTDFTFQFTDRFDVQVGGRGSRNDFTVGEATTAGPINPLVFLRPDPFVAPRFDSDDESYTYLLTPRFRVSPDLMVYARAASGYRPGGPNTSAALIAAGLPREYDADTTQNYEIGVKGAVLDDLFSFDASVYYIEWKDVQLQLRNTVNNVIFQYTLNAGAAKSEGVELSVRARPLEGLTISAWGAYNNAELTSVPTNSVLTAREGDRLPYAARQSGSLSVDQEFPFMSSATGFIGASASYVGDRKGRFFTGVPQGTFPSYKQFDLRAGAKFDTWTVNAFMNNVSDERGVLRAGRDAVNSYLYIVTYTQPRTVGLSFTKSF